MLRSFSHSTVVLSGYVYDSLSNRPIDAAIVRLDGHGDSVWTDTAGMFRLLHTPTGPAVITIFCPWCDAFQKSVDITLHPSADTFFLVPITRRPSFSLVRPQTGRFISNEPVFIEIYINDPDTNFSHVKIDWGDGSDPDSSSSLLQHAYWHRYAQKTDSVMVVRISLFDTIGFFRDSVLDTVLRIPVSVPNPPVLNGIIFEPSQYLAPYDTVVIIGVRISRIEDNYASEIVWIINEHDPQAFKYARDSLDDQRGVIGPIGNVFAHSFSTAALKALNEVQIIVWDKYGNKSSVFGVFYIAGKGE